MANQRAASRYATAIFSLAKEHGNIDMVGNDLVSVKSIVDNDPSIRRYYYAPVIDRNEKTRTLLEAFENKINETALHAVLLLVQKRRENLLGEIIEQYQRLALAERKLEPLLITSARALHQEELQAMVARLASVYGKQFDVRQEVNPELLGGVQVMMGDRRLDGSISGRLEDLATTLFSKS